MDSEQKKFDAADRSSQSVKAGEKAKRQLKVVEDQYQNQSAMTGAAVARPKMFGGVATMFLFNFLRKRHAGAVIAVLPFEPWSFVRTRLSQRGLVGVESFPSGCGYILLSLLITFSLKSVITKLFDIARGGKDTNAGVANMVKAPGMRRLLKKMGGYTEEDLEELEGVMKMFG